MGRSHSDPVSPSLPPGNEPYLSFRRSSTFTDADYVKKKKMFVPFCNTWWVRNSITTQYDSIQYDDEQFAESFLDWRAEKHTKKTLHISQHYDVYCQASFGFFSGSMLYEMTLLERHYVTTSRPYLWSLSFKTGPIFMAYFCTEHYNLPSRPASFTARR